MGMQAFIDSRSFARLRRSGSRELVDCSCIRRRRHGTLRLEAKWRKGRKQQSRETLCKCEEAR